MSSFQLRTGLSRPCGGSSLSVKPKTSLIESRRTSSTTVELARLRLNFMHIGVYGSGYLTTVLSACLADFGMPVVCADENATQMHAMSQGTVPYFEKNLQDVIKRNIRAGRLTFT